MIQFNQKYAEVVKSLLGNVVIARDLKGANDIAKMLQYRSRIVTLDGDVVNPAGR
ncbi:chromosome partition protein smc [Mesobacillus boroniphilus JCM 21738]|uniref:Chromosome partition protein smc n=1 Tax=Mesobacillus boroniphilus JCM 21738 TaxID=1294265 RepID=W4RH36_9BACI|nr:chromosome partition protein smc [Mesobacillus boroniphilus JCM 21738]